MIVIEGLIAWLKTFPGLSGGRLNIDFLPEDAKTYSVDVTPCDGLIKRYMDGSSRRQFTFVIASREFYSQDIKENGCNLLFYEELSSWLEEQTRTESLPDIGEGRAPLNVRVTTTAFPIVLDENGTARYQVQCRLEYFQKGER